MILILGPLTAPRTSAVILYLASSATALTTFWPSTTSTAGNVTVEPTSSISLSTLSTSSTATFSCLPPARTIAYTANPFVVIPAPGQGPTSSCGRRRHTDGSGSTGALSFVETHGRARPRKDRVSR